jgi:hypothetical protein
MPRATVELPADLIGGEGDWSDLTGVLEKLGFLVEVRTRRPRRAAPSETVSIVVHLLDVLENHAIDALVGAVVAAVSTRLGRRRRGKQKTTVTLYGPDGLPLKTIEIPPARNSRTS